MAHRRASRKSAHLPRELAVEALEPRAVPAGMASMVELHLDPAINGYDVVDDHGTGFLIAGGTEEGRIERLNEQGAVVGAIEPTPLMGYRNVGITDISENAQWAIGVSYTRTLDANGDFVSYRYALTLWRLSDPTAPIAVDVSSLGDVPLQLGTDISDQGTFVGSTPDGRLFLASPNGLQPLALPPGTSADQVSQGYFNDISADGRVVVGSLHLPYPSETTKIQPWGKYIYRAVAWRDGRPEFLEYDPTYLASQANAVSDDGRLIGGSVIKENFGHVAAVWIDGHFQVLTNASGDPMHGNVTHVVSGIDGDPSRWIAFGYSYQRQDNETTFVATSDGIAMPLSEWLRTRYDFENKQNALSLTDVLLAYGQLRLFSSKTGFDPLTAYDNPMIRAPISLVQTGTQMITIDTISPGHGNFDSSLDVTGDGVIAPIDALRVIDALNDQVGGGIMNGSLPVGSPLARLDTSGDGKLTPLDALLVIDWLNANFTSAQQSPGMAQNSGSNANNLVAEGEAPNAQLSDDLMALAADELLGQLGGRRRN